MKHRIDPHVHPRPDIGTVASLAAEQGIGTILVMPATPSSLLLEKDLRDKLLEARGEKPAVKCFFYIGLTSNENQIEEAVRLARDYPEVVGLKLYPPENEEKKVFEVLARLGYSGVLAVHAEKVSLFKPYLFDPEKPWTHNLAQPAEAETESIKELIRFALETNFPGTLYIPHISLPESAKIVWQAKKHISIYSEVTPHHLLLSDAVMGGKGGLLLKVNPPLRNRQAAVGLLKAVKDGMIDCLATDYASHPLRKKLFPPYLSGIAAYWLYGRALDFLREQGVAEKDMEKLAYWNIKKVFGEKLKNV